MSDPELQPNSPSNSLTATMVALKRNKLSAKKKVLDYTFAYNNLINEIIRLEYNNEQSSKQLLRGLGCYWVNKYFKKA